MEGFTLSNEGTIIAANQELARMLGYTMNEMIGMSMLKFVVSHDRRRLSESLRNHADGKHALKCIRKDGTIFPIETHTAAWFIKLPFGI